MEEEGTIEQVTFSEWAAPVMPIVKEVQTIRIQYIWGLQSDGECCFKVGLLSNTKSRRFIYNLGGGEKFTKLDLSHGYQQLLLDDDSKKYTTINTRRGLFQYNRLPYGISSAPGIFQRTMENLLQGIRHCSSGRHILVSGENEEEHVANLEEVLKRLSSAGARLKKTKCVFMAPRSDLFGTTSQQPWQRLQVQEMHRN